jgi:eukaryotic-like serine/threonine-protein kinase
MPEDVTTTRLPVGSPNSAFAPTVGADSLPADETPALPSNIGHYRILRLLGEGGMGAVYEAEQESPHRRVALKVIRAGYTSGEMLRRFENEAQALGRLQHPGIAQIYEASTAETAFGRQPYFAMELVRGQTLLAYCDEHKLTVRQRLELFAKICDAVQHAHQRGLIHRDLKPANILVNESGEPKILDFGLARLTDSDAQATRRTGVGQILGTLAYMSPEQVLGDPEELDTRSDVYALGVILYELLAGKMPYTLSRQVPEALRAIREEEPTRLSSVNRTYRGDVETIVAKALEKDKTRRYASAAEMGADIRRYLDDEPIIARPPSTTYQLRKFARRNKALVAGVAAVFVVLVLGIMASTWEAVRARRAESKAKEQAAIAQAVNDFLQKDLLGQASAYNQSKPDPNITVRTVLDRAAQNIQGKFAGQPEVEAAIRQTLGNTYRDLGLYPEAQQQLEAALDIRRRALGPEHPDTLTSMSNLGAAYSDEGKYAQAEALDQIVLSIRRRVLGPEHPDSLASMFNLGVDYSDEGKYAQAEALDQQVLSIRRRVLGPEHPDTLASMYSLAVDYEHEGKYAQAEALNRQVVDIRRRILGPEHPDTLQSMNGLIADYEYEGKYAQAQALEEQVVSIQRRVLGPEHPQTLRSMFDLAIAYRWEGKFAQAEALNRQVVDIRRRVLGPEHPDTLQSMDNLAADYRGEGKYAQAEALDQQVLSTQRRVLGPEHPDALTSMDDVALDYRSEGKYAQAEDVLRQALKGAPNNPRLLNDYAWLLLIAKDHRWRRPEEALELANRAVKLSPERGIYLNTLGLAEVRNKRWAEAITTLDKSAKADNGSDPTDFFFLAMAYHGREDNADAEKNYARGVEMARKTAANDADLRMLWAEAASDLGKPVPRLLSK